MLIKYSFPPFQSAGQFITDLYVTLPSSIASVPQFYTIHCIYITDTPELKVQYRMESSRQSCLATSLSCNTTQIQHVTASEGDVQLAVTWHASTVFTEGTYRPLPKQHLNGDHDFACETIQGNKTIRHPITVRGRILFTL